MILPHTGQTGSGADVAADTTVRLQGDRVAILLVAVATFHTRLPEANLDHYDVLIAPDGDQLQVIFLPRLAEGERPQRGGGTSLGREFNVWISPADGTVQRTSFAR